MERRVAIVTGGLRGLGRAMAFGLAREGHDVVAVGHIDADVSEVEAATSGANFAGQVLPLAADLRQPAQCDRIIAMAQERFGTPQILVNNAGLTFTTIDPDRFRRAEPQKFWKVPDDIVRAVIETNYIAADQMCHHSFPSRSILLRVYRRDCRPRALAGACIGGWPVMLSSPILIYGTWCRELWLWPTPRDC